MAGANALSTIDVDEPVVVDIDSSDLRSEVKTAAARTISNVSHTGGNQDEERPSWTALEQWHFALVLVSAALHYFDFITDVALSVQLYREDRSNLFGWSVAFICLRVVIVLALEFFNGDSSVKMMLLDLFHLRMVYNIVRALTKTPTAARKATESLKLIETIVESVPQSILQLYILLIDSVAQDQAISTVLALSLSASFLSIAFAFANKVVALNASPTDKIAVNSDTTQVIQDSGLSDLPSVALDETVPDQETTGGSTDVIASEQQEEVKQRTFSERGRNSRHGPKRHGIVLEDESVSRPEHNDHLDRSLSTTSVADQETWRAFFTVEAALRLALAAMIFLYFLADALQRCLAIALVLTEGKGWWLGIAVLGYGSLDLLLRKILAPKSTSTDQAISRVSSQAAGSSKRTISRMTSHAVEDMQPDVQTCGARFRSAAARTFEALFDFLVGMIAGFPTSLSQLDLARLFLVSTISTSAMLTAALSRASQSSPQAINLQALIQLCNSTSATHPLCGSTQADGLSSVTIFDIMIVSFWLAIIKSMTFVIFITFVKTSARTGLDIFVLSDRQAEEYWENQLQRRAHTRCSKKEPNNFEGRSISKAEMDALALALDKLQEKSLSIRKLKLARNFIGNDGLKRFAASYRNWHLKRRNNSRGLSIDLRQNSAIEASGLRLLMDHAFQDRLQSYFRRQRIEEGITFGEDDSGPYFLLGNDHTNHGIQLDQFAALITLFHGGLNLSDKGISEDVLLKILSTTDTTRLRELDLSGNDDIKDLSAIAKALKRPSKPITVRILDTQSLTAESLRLLLEHFDPDCDRDVLTQELSCVTFQSDVFELGNGHVTFELNCLDQLFGLGQTRLSLQGHDDQSRLDPQSLDNVIRGLEALDTPLEELDLSNNSALDAHCLLRVHGMTKRPKITRLNGVEFGDQSEDARAKFEQILEELDINQENYHESVKAADDAKRRVLNGCIEIDDTETLNQFGIPRFRRSQVAIAEGDMLELASRLTQRTTSVTLQEIVLENVHFDDPMWSAFATVLHGGHSLKIIHLVKCGITSARLKQLAPALLPSLARDLEVADLRENPLDGSSLTEFGVEACKQMEHKRVNEEKCTRFRLNGNNFSASEVYELLSSLKIVSPNNRALEFAEAGDDRFIVTVKGVLELSQATEVVEWLCSEDSSPVEEPRNASFCCRVEEQGMSSESLIAVLKMLRYTSSKARAVKFDGCKAVADHLDLLADAFFNNFNIKYIRLHQVAMTTAAAKAFLAQCGLKTPHYTSPNDLPRPSSRVTLLDSGYILIKLDDDRSIETSEANVAFSWLGKRLDLSEWGQNSQASAEKFQYHLSALDLTHLKIENRPIGDIGAGQLKAAPMSLTSLQLRYCRIKAEGLGLIFMGLTKPTCILKELDISGNALDEAADDLAQALEGNTSLRSLFLEHTNLTPSGCDAILRALSCEGYKPEPLFHRLQDLSLSWNSQLGRGLSAWSQSMTRLLLDPKSGIEILSLESCNLKKLGFLYTPLQDTYTGRYGSLQRLWLSNNAFNIKEATSFVNKLRHKDGGGLVYPHLTQVEMSSEFLQGEKCNEWNKAVNLTQKCSNMPTGVSRNHRLWRPRSSSKASATSSLVGDARQLIELVDAAWQGGASTGAPARSGHHRVHQVRPVSEIVDFDEGATNA
eukprot:m.287238 g.287238  ORF g.287238 m.287238 type:complete len:1661 (+) comp17786_c0_seq6:35-5017(+)